MTFVNKRHLIIAGVICVLGYPQQVVSGSSLASRFSCININGTPASVVEQDWQASPDHFGKSDFLRLGWTRRVSGGVARLELHAGTLEYITTGRMNGLPVICVARTDGGACRTAHLTQPFGYLEKLFDVRTCQVQPLEETICMYLSMDSIRKKSGL